jgi:hypothetical protein
MLPTSWKANVQEAVDEKISADKNERITEQRHASAEIAAAINSLRQAQETQTSREDANEKTNQTINKITLGLVAATVLFTGLSWWAFHEQISEIKKVYGPIKDQADAAKQSAQTASDALTKAQRSFVFEKDIFYGVITKNGKKIWRGAFRWQNSGLTPTKNADVSFSCMSVQGFPTVVDPYTLVEVATRSGASWRISQTFPPKDVRVAGECEFMNGELLKAQRREYTQYSMVQVTYTDIFDISHTTRFCEFAYDVEGDVEGFTGNIVVTGAPCVRYNCADDECKKEDAEPNLPPEKLVPPNPP